MARQVNTDREVEPVGAEYTAVDGSTRWVAGGDVVPDGWVAIRRKPEAGKPAGGRGRRSKATGKAMASPPEDK